ncbi:hypothetical protein CFP56_023417 [Quercus suber]|uniref:Uncharacterized protein n=1 Tax=Quercus suber TaxID=58331 RepID=A0AAW0KA03_QUESU
MTPPSTLSTTSTTTRIPTFSNS